MPDLKVSQLPAYNAILSGQNDAILIVDSTNVASKKISPQALANAFMFSGSSDPIGIPVVQPAIYLNTDAQTTWIFNNITSLWIEVTGGNVVTFLPYISFTSADTGSTNQVFTSPSFAYYSAASLMSVSVNGVLISPSVNYSLSGISLTILDFLPPASLVEVSAKTVPGLPVITDITTQAGDEMVTQAGDNLILN